MDHIDKVLATSSDSACRFTLAIRAALAIGKKAMNQYYNKTDQSEVYRIAMGIPFFFSPILILTMSLVLHHCHKLEYFKKQKWEVSWIQDTHEIVCHKFDRSYATVDAHGDGDDMPVGNSEALLVSYTNI
jgi:hypothetical protein